MAAEDLLTSLFPDQVACAENLPGELEIPIIRWCGRPSATASKRRWISKVSSSCYAIWSLAGSKLSLAM